MPVRRIDRLTRGRRCSGEMVFVYSAMGSDVDANEAVGGRLVTRKSGAVGTSTLDPNSAIRAQLSGQIPVLPVVAGE